MGIKESVLWILLGICLTLVFFGFAISASLIRLHLRKNFPPIPQRKRKKRK